MNTSNHTLQSQQLSQFTELEAKTVLTTQALTLVSKSQYCKLRFVWMSSNICLSSSSSNLPSKLKQEQNEHSQGVCKSVILPMEHVN